MNNKAPLKSIFSRSKKILSTTVKIASKELSTKKNEIQKLNLRVEQAKLLVSTLGELKGGAMKFGQMLSIDSDDWLPKEVVEVLSKLQKDAPPVDSNEMFFFLKSQLGLETFKQLNLDPTPIAQASIGQVYKGRYNEQDIVIKIQYPGISETISSDLKLIRPLVKNLSTIMGKKIDYAQMFEEIKTVLTKEADYLYEAECIEQYAKNFENFEQFEVPKLIPELSTSKILAMSFIEGPTLNDWIEQNPSNDKKEEVANLMLKLFKEEFFNFGLVQTDPNPANFLIKENPLRVVCLDLGASVSYSQEFIKDYKTLIKYVLQKDRQKMVECFVHSDMIDSRESEKCIEMFIKMQFHAAKPFNKDYQPFDYSSVEFNKQLKKNAYDFIKSLKYSSPPKELIFLHRKFGGVFLILKKLAVKIDTSNYFDDIL